MKREVRLPILRVREERLELDCWRREYEYDRRRALLAVAVLCVIGALGIGAWLFGGVW